jgi:hypothetical protein
MLTDASVEFIALVPQPGDMLLDEGRSPLLPLDLEHA